MRNRVERLRIWLAGSAIFLMLVIAAFIGYARFLSRFHHLKLPAKLGINIVRETNGYTVSQSLKGKTVYTIHASKAVEHTDGKIALHDVSILLYGRSGDRQARIYGEEFEYDVKAGVVRALGLVHIDFEGAKSAAGTPAKPREPAKDSKRFGGDFDSEPTGDKLLHVTTSGLMYMEKLGVAATSDYIEFRSGTLKGHATGADYSNDSGVLHLHSAVNMAGTEGGRPVNINAATAEFDERSQQAFLTQAKYESEGRTLDAEHATLHRRQDGSLSRVEAQGNVTLGANGGKAVSQRADVLLNAVSRPASATLTGNVLYTLEEPLRQVRGTANEATIAFDSQATPQPQHAVFTGGVHMIERTRATDSAREPWSVRDLTAAKVVTTLASIGSGNPQLRDAEATGNPHLTIVNSGSLANPSGNGRTELSADELKAHLTASASGKQPHIDTLEGRGQTVLHRWDAKGVEQTSTGDTLQAKFRPATVSAGAKAAQPARSGGDAPLNVGLEDTLISAVQNGHVTMTRRAPAKSKTGQAKADDVQHATAARATYDGDHDRVTLTGGVQASDTGSLLWANQLIMNPTTGDSQAVGSVKVDYVQEGGPGPTHILADRADLEHATDTATFHGKPVRMWQGGSQVQAPVVELSRSQKRLVARGEAASGPVAAGSVRTVLVNAGGDKPATTDSAVGKATMPRCGPPKSTAGNAVAVARTSNVVRITSGGLVYSDAQKEANFTGGVRADTVDGTIRAGQATAYLQQTRAQGTASGAASDGATAVPSLAGNLERVVASGHVDITRPDLQATGEKLVYTAADRVFLLTGDGKAQPRAVTAQGTTSAAALRFDSCENSVEALGSVPGAPETRVQTDSRVSEERKKEKDKR